MSTTRNAWIVLGVLSTLAAVGSFFLIQVMKALVGMVIMDWSSSLRSEGLITEARWNQLIDGMAPHITDAFRPGTLVPMAFLLLALVHFFMAWRVAASAARDRSGAPPRPAP